MKNPRVPSNTAKKIPSVFLLLSIALILCGCPFSSTYKLDSESSIPVDESLLGKWACMVENSSGNEQPVKMIIGRKNETEYNIDFTGDLKDLWRFRVVENDTIKGSAFMSMVNDRPFLNIEVRGQTYLVAVDQKDGKLSLLPLTDGFTSKYIKSNEVLRKAVEVHLHTWSFPHYDDQFCLKGMVRVN